MGSRLDSTTITSHQEARSDDHTAEAEIRQVMCEILEETACKLKVILRRINRFGTASDFAPPASDIGRRT